MGRSRKKTSGGQGGLSEGEMRKVVMLLVASSILIGMAIIILISGAVRKSRQAEPQLALQQTQAAEQTVFMEAGKEKAQTGSEKRLLRRNW